MTCEIVNLDKGYLYVKLDYADGTVALDWSKVVRIESPQTFVIVDKEGRRYSGSLQSLIGEKSIGDLRVEVVNEASTRAVMSAKDIVGVDQTDTRFWRNLRGAVDLGLNYAKQQNRAQYSLDTNVTYERRSWSSDATFGSSFNGGGGISSLRNDLRLNVQKQLRLTSNFYLGTAEFLHNDEQQLSLRTTFGGALGHNFLHTNNSLVSVYGGMTWSRANYESSTASNPTEDSAEAIVGTQASFFRFKTANLLVDARAYPSLSDLGRTRFDLNTSLKFKIAKNLSWNFAYYLNVDSRPPRNLPKSDYGSSSSLGWTF